MPTPAGTNRKARLARSGRLVDWRLEGRSAPWNESEKKQRHPQERPRQWDMHDAV